MSNQLHDFLPIRSKVELFFFDHYFWIIPTVYLFRSLIEWLDVGRFPYNLLDHLKMSTELLLVAAVFLSLRLIRESGPKLQELLFSPALSAKDGTHIARLVRDFDLKLNHPLRIVLGSLVSVVVFSYYIARLGGPQAVISGTSLSLRSADLFLYFVPPAFYAFFVGTLLWRLGFLICFLASIPRFFDVNPVLDHPDGARGLDSVGYFCTQILWIVLLPTALSAMILLSAVINSIVGVAIVPIGNEVLVKFFAPFIILVSLLGLALLFIPLAAFTSASRFSRYEEIALQGEIAKKIIALKRKCLKYSCDGDIELDDALTRLEYLEGIYTRIRNSSVLPLGKQRLRGIVALFGYYFSQFAALWGFFSGLIKVAD